MFEIRQRGPVGLTADQCRQPRGIAKVMYGAELAWRNALAAATVADLIENAAGVSADRAARWLGTQARAGLLDRSNPRTSLRTDRTRQVPHLASSRIKEACRGSMPLL
jgi:hypothetical protein